MKKLLFVILSILVVTVFAEYNLRIGDVLRVEVFSHEEMTRDCLIDPDGFISYVGAGRLKVAGLTVGETQELITQKLSKIIPNPIVAVSVVEFAPRYVYVQGYRNTVVDVGTGEMTLTKLISLIGNSSNDGNSLNDIDISAISIRRGGDIHTIDLRPFYESGDLSVDVPLAEGDVIYIPRKGLTESVKVLGMVRNPGVFPFEKGMTVFSLISLAGGVMVESADTSSITLIRSGQRFTLDLDSISSGESSDIQIEPGDQLYVPPLELRYAYINGFVAQPGVYEFTPDEPLTLKRLITKAGGLSGDVSYVSKILVKDNESTFTVNASQLTQEGDIEIQIGSYVEVIKKQDKYVYVLGEVKEPGRIDFFPEEPLKLSTVISKSGGFVSLEIEKSGKIKVFHGDGSSQELSCAEIMEQDLSLQVGDTVYVESHENVYVYVVGNTALKGRIELDFQESPRLSTVIKKVGISDPQSYKSVVVVEDKKVFQSSLDEVIEGKVDFDLRSGMTIIFELLQDRYVYFIGDVSNCVVFSKDEEFSLQKAIAKAGLTLSEVEKIELLRDDNYLELKPEQEANLVPGDVLRVTKKKSIQVAVLGMVSRPGYVVFTPLEKPTLQNALAKCGGVISSLDKYYISDKVVVYSKDKVNTFDASQIESSKADIMLSDGDLVYVSQKKPHYAFASGPGVGNKRIVFAQGEPFTLSCLVGKLNLSEDISQRVTLISPAGTTTTFGLDNLQKGRDVQLTDGSIVLFEKDYESYVHILGMVRTPGSYFIQGRELSLLEALSIAGGITDWGSYTQIVIKRGEERHELDLSDPVAMNSVLVKPGDILYVPPVEANVVYALGEVARPGIVKIDKNSTVLDVIMKSGGFSSRAVSSKVYLFKGGPTGEPIVCDLSATLRGRPARDNPLVSPGDVIFVPDNPLMNIIDLIPVVNSMINLIQNAQQIIQ